MTTGREASIPTIASICVYSGRVCVNYERRTPLVAIVELLTPLRQVDNCATDAVYPV